MKCLPIAVMFCTLAGATHAESAIWEIKSATAKVYLFGTMHLLPKHSDWLGPKIAAAFDASNVLVEEADITLVQPRALASIMNQAESPDTDLFTMLSPKSAAKFTKLVHSCHLPNAVVAHFKPWFAAMLPTVCKVMDDNNGDIAASAGPESTLIMRAKKSGKKIDFFETPEQQIGYLANAPQRVQMAQLEQAIDEASEADLEAMEHSWASGDLAALARLIQKDRHDDEASYQTIFVHRNERFAAAITSMLHANNTVFVAIGAGHLAGPDSVQAHLATQGFVANRL